jgi:hypothetical protein
MIYLYSGSEKPIKEITAEISTIIRQITASVTYLPLLPDACTFDLLVYTGKDVQVPTKWEESEPRYIVNSEQVKLYSFSTKVRFAMLGDSLVCNMSKGNYWRSPGSQGRHSRCIPGGCRINASTRPRIVNYAKLEICCAYSNWLRKPA